MENLLEVREFDTITCNKDYENSPSALRYLDEGHFQRLEHFIKEYSSDADEADALEFMKIGYRRGVGDTVSFNNYVGIVELSDGFQIEILPKVSFDEEDGDYRNTKRIFLTMLRCLREFEGKSFTNASLNADRMNLYEIFINMYLQETRKLIKRGIKSVYLQKEENIAFYKGKMNVSQHIKENSAHKERFFMRYDEYQVNRAENRIVKSVLMKLLKESRSADNVREIRQLLSSFELVDASVNYEKDFSEVSIGRDTKDYEPLIQWARIFLYNKSFTTFSGEKAGRALLFPMETVFEAFVAKWIRTIFADHAGGRVHVSAQDKGYFLFDVPRKFKLRPDIVVRGNAEGQERTIIMDTKWKRLKPDPGANYGISQSDMYQMYAYSKKYHTPDIWLLYPLYDGVKDVSDLNFRTFRDEEQSVNVRVFFIDLVDYRGSIEELYDRVFD